MLSIWEKIHWTSFDLIVVGGGIVGMSTALSWRERHPDHEILVLEKGSLPTGASTRNAGFACFGSLTELLIDIKKLGPDGSFNLVKKRWDGLQKLRNRLGDENLDLQIKGGYELLREKELYAKNHIDEVNLLLKELFNENVFEIADDRLKPYSFNTERVKGMLYNKYEGQLDSGLMMKSLVKMARERNIEIRTGCQVLELKQDTGELEVKDTIRKNYYLKGDKIAICTNGFAKELIPELNLNPGRGLVLVTEKLRNLPFEGTFHYDEGFYYFRDYYGHIIFGGGRNYDFDNETTTSFEVNEKIFEHLKDELYNVIMPNHKPKISMTWSGIMGFGDTKEPIISRVSDHIGVAVRLGGMGVAIGTSAGEELSKKLG